MFIFGSLVHHKYSKKPVILLNSIHFGNLAHHESVEANEIYIFREHGTDET